MDEFLTIKQLAAELNVPVGTIYQWNHRGRAPKRHQFGRLVRYRRSDVEKWIEDRAVKSINLSCQA